MTDRGRSHVLVVVRIVHTGEDREQFLGDVLAGAHSGLTVAQVRALIHIPILDTIHREVVVGHVEALTVGLEVRVTSRSVQIMATVKLLQIGEVTLRGQVLGFAEAQIGRTLTRVLDLITRCAGIVSVVLPLTVLVAQYLLVGQARNRLDVQLKGHLRLEPLIQTIVVLHPRVCHDIVVQ